MPKGEKGDTTEHENDLTSNYVEHIVNIIDFGVPHTHMFRAADDCKATNIARDFRCHLAS
jgi:hypothetical protein